MSGKCSQIKMLTTRWLVPLLYVSIFSDWVSSTNEDNSGILIRLSSVEDKTEKIQKENVHLGKEIDELRLENQKLVEENDDLKKNFLKLGRQVEFQMKESQLTKDRLSKAENEIRILKSGPRQGVPYTSAHTNSPTIRSASYGTENIVNRSSTKRVKGNSSTSQASRTRISPGGRRNAKRLLLTRSITSPPRDRVSFSAHMGRHATNLGQDQKLIFDIVNNNEGGGYDKLSGIFTCPISGTYFFIVHILSYSGKDIAVTMAVNNVDKAFIDADAHGDAGEAQGSSSLVIHCNKGNEVWIKYFTSNPGGNNVYGGRHSHFGGFILWAD